MTRPVTYPRYPAYKDPGVEWLGEIPEGWTMDRFRNMFVFRKGLNITKENLEEHGVPCVNYGEIHSKYGFEVDPSKHVLKCVDDEYIKTSSKSLLQYGDFIFADTSEDIEGAGNFTYLNSQQTIFAGYHTIIARLQKADNNFRFLAYTIDSISFRSQIRQAVKGVKVFSITNTILKNTILWLPPLPEQTAIAHFLDDKCAKIDQTIAQKERLIELLKERRQILIQEAVTGKTVWSEEKQAFVPLSLSGVVGKDTGVEWIDGTSAGSVQGVPVHWEVSKLGFYSKSIQTGPFGSQLHSHEYIEDGIPVINPSQIIHDQIVPNRTQTITKKKFNELKLHELEPGNIVFGRRGEMGRCALVLDDHQRMITGTGSIKIVLDTARVYPPFLNYYLSIKAVKSWFSLNSVGSTMENLNAGILSALPIVSLPIKEQIKIVSFIESQSFQIDQAITLQQTQIEKLKEYKATLIDSAVTGKIKVS